MDTMTKETAKHTPRLWTTKRDGEKLNMVVGREGKRTFTVAHVLSTDEDARLIASAPELLDVAKKVYALLFNGVKQDLVKELENAIANAEGSVKSLR